MLLGINYLSVKPIRLSPIKNNDGVIIMWNEFNQLVTFESPTILQSLKEFQANYTRILNQGPTLTNVDDLINLQTQLETINDAINELDLRPNFISNLIYNTGFYLTQSITNLTNQDPETYDLSFRFALKGLIKRLCFEAYTFIMVSEHQVDTINANEKNFLAKINQDRSLLPIEGYKYLASIIVYAYKNVEITKACIDSIYQFTNGIGTEVELIIRSDGAGDQELNDYLSTLNVKKTFIYPKNVRLFDDVLEAAEGKYIFGVNNDIVVTENWLSNLLTVLETDKNVGMVIPVTNQAGNNQTVPLLDEQDDIQTAQEKASQFNRSDATNWFHREKLNNYLWGMPSKLVKGIMLDDLQFNGGFFSDDDLSLRIRLAGYSIVLASDTFVYHHGSVSYSEAPQEQKVAASDTFFRKYLFSTWGPNFNTNYLSGNKTINHLIKSASHPVKILALDDGIAANSLNLSNIALDNHISCELFGSYHNKVYLPYVESTFNEIYSFPYDGDFTRVTDNQFDLIFFGNSSPLDNNYLEILAKLQKSLTQDGKIILLVDNVSNIDNIVKSIKNANANFVWWRQDSIHTNANMYQTLVSKLESQLTKTGFNPTPETMNRLLTKKVLFEIDHR
jgi:GT2 family glycosyltransferase